jgi:hypothetical protein
MTTLLEKALSEVTKLPPEEQDAIAAILLQEIGSEQRWVTCFANSQDALAEMAEEALAEYRARRSECASKRVSKGSYIR